MQQGRELMSWRLTVEYNAICYMAARSHRISDPRGDITPGRSYA